MFDENQPLDQWDSPEQCFVRMTKDHLNGPTSGGWTRFDPNQQ